MLKLDKKLNNYITQYSSPESDVLADLNRHTFLNVIQPRMLSGHIQGKTLEMISLMMTPEYILEIGTFTGYSAICLAQGLKENGKIYTIEINDELEDMVREYIKKAHLEEKIEMLIGDALQIIPTLNMEFDLVFIDGDKKEYTEYFNLIFPKLRKGGFILADNVLWDGKVVDHDSSEDPDTKAIMDFNNMIVQHPEIENFILPIRDGINIIRKK